MANEIKVDTERMKTDCDDLKESITALEKALEKMYEAVNSLDGMWDGPSNDAFKAAFNSDAKTMKGVVKRLSKLRDSIKFARSEYVKTIGKVNDLVNGIRV